MLTEDLNIYRSMYNLLRLLMQARNQFDKAYKYVVGDKMIDTALGCVSLIHYANEDRRKGAREEHLDKFLIEFDILKTLIMVCRDERQYKRILSLPTSLYMSLMLKIRRQLGVGLPLESRSLNKGKGNPGAPSNIPSLPDVR